MLKSKRSITLFFALTLIACAVPMRADIILLAQSSSALPGTEGTFEVDIANTGSSAVEIGGFAFEVTTTNTDVTFTDATVATTAYTYIFSGNSLFGPDIAFSGAGQTFDAGDNASTPFSYTTLDPGETLGLGLVFFDVSPTANAPETVTVSFNLNDSSLSDGNGNPVSIDGSQSATISVAPEPSQALGLFAALGALALRKWKRRT